VFAGLLVGFLFDQDNIYQITSSNRVPELIN
jgi:hypothetical protein